MDRWTVKKLNNTGDIDFAIGILNERKIKLNPFSPLGSKISSAVTTLEKLKNEQGTDARKPEISVRRRVILDFIKFEAETAVVWPWAMPAEKMLQDEAFLSTLEEAVTFDESGSCDTEELYGVIDRLSGVNPVLWDNPEGKRQDNTLAGGYILLSTYATLTDEEAEALRATDETPTAAIAVKKDWLEAWIKPEYATLEEFLDDYTFDTIANLSAEAELEGELAFEYRDGLDDPFLFPKGCSGDAMLAFVDFLSGKLQENGHEEASKYLDCLLSL